MSRIGVLRDSTNRAEAATFATVQAAATAMGMTAVDGDARAAAAMPEVFAAVVRAGVNGLYVSPSGLNNSQRKLTADFTLAKRLPAMFGNKRFVSQGGLMSYWTDWNDLRRRSAAYAIGLSPPRSLRLRADQLIE